MKSIRELNVSISKKNLNDVGTKRKGKVTQKRTTKKGEKRIENRLSSESDDDYEEILNDIENDEERKIPDVDVRLSPNITLGSVIASETEKNLESPYLPNEIINNIKYYAGSKSRFIKIFKYTVDTEIPSTKKIYISCNEWNSLIQEKGFVNGQIIDAYIITLIKRKWNENITFLPTDDKRTAIGDYSQKTRSITMSLYNTDTPLKDVLLLAYSYHFHWRLLIVDTKNTCLTLMDPFAEATDSDRVFKEFQKFANYRNKTHRLEN